MFPDRFCQEKCRNRRHYERNDSQAQRMRQDRSVPALAFWKCRKKLCDTLTEINGQAQNRAQLDHDRVHLPVAAREINVQKRFADSQMRSGADR